MKKLFVSLILVASTIPAFAQHYNRHNHSHFRSGPGWGYIVAPLVIGGIAGAAIANNRQPETVIIQQTTPPLPVIVNQNCTPWTETQYSDGTITRTRTCSN